MTGAARGLGYAYAEALAVKGAHVAVNDLHPEAVESAVDRLVANGGSALGLPGSVTDWEFSRRMLETLIEKFGVVHSAVDNVGVFHAALGGDDSERQIARASTSIC